MKKAIKHICFRFWDVLPTSVFAYMFGFITAQIIAGNGTLTKIIGDLIHIAQ